MVMKVIEGSHKTLKEQDMLTRILDGSPLSDEELELLAEIGAIDPGDQVALLQVQGLKGIIEIKN